MKLRRVSLRGITCFTEPVSVDFEAIGGGLVALVGRNGAGKTTLLSAVPAALYRDMPDRPGSLYEHAHGRDAFVEAVLEDGGQEVTARLLVDVVGRRMEHHFLVDGVAQSRGLASDATPLIRQRCGSYEMFLATVYASQSRLGDFLRMTKGDRKDLFAELLQLGQLEVFHVWARERFIRAEAELAGVRSRIMELELEVGAGADLDEKRQAAQTWADETARQLEAAREAEATATADLERARAAEVQAAALEAADAGARREVEAARRAVTVAEDLAPKARAAAHGKRESLKAHDPSAAEASARRRHKDGLAALEGRREKLEATAAKREAIEQARLELPGLEADHQRLLARDRELVALTAQTTESRDALHAARERLKDAERVQRDETSDLERQAELLKEAPCSVSADWFASAGGLIKTDLRGTCPLISEARAAKERLADQRDRTSEPRRALEAAERKGRELLANLQALAGTAGVAADVNALVSAGEKVEKARALIAEAPHVEAAARELEGLAQERLRLDAELATDLEDVTAAQKKVLEATAAIEAALAADLKAAADEVRLAQATLSGAEARAETAAAELRRHRATALDLAAAAFAHGDAQTARKAAETASGDAVAELAAVQAKLERLRELEGQLKVQAAAADLAAQAVGDWGLLRQAFGKDGIQALEIAAAGPEVARVCNELLLACYDARFSVAFDTLRAKRSAPGEFSEAFDVKVFDAGHERAAEALSGGERVVVGEAIGLAISIFNARKSGVRWRTLFRDETAGALDPRNAQAYVDMLRRARGLGGFDQVIFVSHQEQVWERADARVLVEGGRVSVDASKPSVAAPVALAG